MNLFLLRVLPLSLRLSRCARRFFCLMAASTTVPRPDHIVDVADNHELRGMAAGLSRIALQKECLNRTNDRQTVRQSSRWFSLKAVHGAATSGIGAGT
jgi:hypothetical protein